MHEDGNFGPISINPADGSSVVGKKFVTTTRSGRIVHWKMVKFGPRSDNYPLTIGIFKPGCD